jgi:hypothetical protein
VIDSQTIKAPQRKTANGYDAGNKIVAASATLRWTPTVGF